MWLIKLHFIQYIIYVKLKFHKYTNKNVHNMPYTSHSFKEIPTMFFEILIINQFLFSFEKLFYFIFSLFLFSSQTKCTLQPFGGHHLFFPQQNFLFFMTKTTQWSHIFFSCKRKVFFFTMTIVRHKISTFLTHLPESLPLTPWRTSQGCHNLVITFLTTFIPTPS